jgi:hypothetical protein
MCTCLESEGRRRSKGCCSNSERKKKGEKTMRVSVVRSLQGRVAGISPNLSCWRCRCCQRCQRKQPILLQTWRRGASVSQHHSRNWQGLVATNVDVAVKYSTLPALEMITSTTENTTVDATMKLSLAIGEWTKKRMNADRVGSRAARIVLRASMIAWVVLSG